MKKNCKIVGDGSLEIQPGTQLINCEILNNGLIKIDATSVVQDCLFTIPADSSLHIEESTLNNCRVINGEFGFTTVIKSNLKLIDILGDGSIEESKLNSAESRIKLIHSYITKATAKYPIRGVTLINSTLRNVVFAQKEDKNSNDITLFDVELSNITIKNQPAQILNVKPFTTTIVGDKAIAIGCEQRSLKEWLRIFGSEGYWKYENMSLADQAKLLRIIGDLI